MFTSKTTGRVAALCLTTALNLSSPAHASPATFDGTWNVSLSANGGMLCRLVPGLSFTARNGSVQGGSHGISVSGRIGSSGDVSLTFQSSGMQGSGSGMVSGTSGSGSWTMPSLGCSGQWTARRA